MDHKVIEFPQAGNTGKPEPSIVIKKTAAIGATSGPKFVSLDVPASFPVERLTKFFGECGYMLQSRPGGVIRVIPFNGVYKFSTPTQRILSHFGVGLPHNRWRKHLLRARQELKAK